MACIYWIHLPEHTDLFREGYIGFTSKTLARRFTNHKSNARTFRNQTVGIERAIRKHGDRLITEILCIGTQDYCLDLEKRLRSVPGIGWNCSVGGGPVILDKKATEKARENMRRAKVGFVFSPAHRKAISVAKREFLPLPACGEGRKQIKIFG